jgi:hypothetical protein
VGRRRPAVLRPFIYDVCPLAYRASAVGWVTLKAIAASAAFSSFTA